MKVWTGRYWMTNKHRRKISNGLKKHYKDNVVWNKGKKFVDDEPILLEKQFKPWITDEDGFRLMDLRASVGLGIRLGPLSFDFAKKTDLRSFGKGYKFHFGLGQDF